MGEPDVYGEDRVFAYLRNARSARGAARRGGGALGDAGHPTLTLTTDDAADLGRIFFLAEFAVAVSGWALEINPFDQPNVQEAKDNTKRVLDSGSVPELAGRRRRAAARAARRRGAAALCGDHGVPAALGSSSTRPSSELRAAIRAATGAATTFGYGPRFLHSTGQLHKGGPPTGRFLQLVNDPTRDAEIPAPATRSGR